MLTLDNVSSVGQASSFLIYMYYVAERRSTDRTTTAQIVTDWNYLGQKQLLDLPVILPVVTKMNDRPNHD